MVWYANLRHPSNDSMKRVTRALILCRRQTGWRAVANVVHVYVTFGACVDLLEIFVTRALCWRNRPVGWKNSCGPSLRSTALMWHFSTIHQFRVCMCVHNLWFVLGFMRLIILCGDDIINNIAWPRRSASANCRFVAMMFVMLLKSVCVCVFKALKIIYCIYITGQDDEWIFVCLCLYVLR